MARYFHVGTLTFFKCPTENMEEKFEEMKKKSCLICRRNLKLFHFVSYSVNFAALALIFKTLFFDKFSSNSFEFCKFVRSKMLICF